MRPLKESIGITLDGDVLSEVKARAEFYQRSVSQYINLVLKEHLQNNAMSQDKNKL